MALLPILQKNFDICQNNTWSFDQHYFKEGSNLLGFKGESIRNVDWNTRNIKSGITF